MFEDVIKKKHRGFRGNVPQCLGNKLTSQAVLGYSGQKYAGTFAFLCCELHMCPLPRAQPIGRGHGFYWFSLCR